METGKLTVKEYLGTGKIAKLFGVAPRTVAKWIDKELLHGTRIPGSKHRRVALSEVYRFSKEHNVPLLENDDQTELTEDVLVPESVVPLTEEEQTMLGDILTGQPKRESVPDDDDDDDEVVGAGVTSDIIGRKEV